jgi:hypothetical protein
MPAEQWAKLHAKLAESVDFADLYEASHEAALLFLMSLPQAVPWGVLPGDPRLFGRRVCGMLGLGSDKIKTCLRLIVDSGMYRAYTDEEGRQLLYVTHWNENQQRQWGRCGLPEFKLPPDWTPPEGISNELATAKAKGRGLTAEALAECVVSDESKTQSKTALSLSLANGYLKRSREVEKLENDVTAIACGATAPPAHTVQADAEEGATTHFASLPQVASSVAKPRKRQDPDAVVVEIDELRLQFAPGDVPMVDEFMDMARRHRTRTMALSVERNYTRELLDLREERGMTSDAFRYGISCAVRADADNVKYAAKAARTSLAQGTVNPPVTRAAPEPVVDPFREMDILAGRTAR